MKRSTLVPVNVTRTFAKIEKALSPDLLPNYLRNLTFDPNNEYESVYVPRSNATVYPTVVGSATCIPVYLGTAIPTTEYERVDLGIKFNDKYADTIVYLYRPKITYGSGSERNDNLNYRNDTTSALYLKVGSSIQDTITEVKPFRITIPYEGKPEKIAYKVYGDHTYWWVIMQYNGFIYPSNCVLDEVIMIPDFNQVVAWLKTIQPSTANAMQYRGTRIRL